MKKKKNEKEQRGEEQKPNRDKLKIDRYLSRSALEMMKGNPDVLRMMVSKTFGFEIPTLAEQRESEVSALIDELVIKKINENQGLQQDIVNARIEQLMESLGMVKDGEEWRRRPMTLDDLTMQFEKLNVLKETIGIKSKGFLEELVSPEIINLILMTITEVLKNRQSGPSEETRILVRIDGERVAITPEKYKQLAAEGRIQVIADIGSEPPDNPGNGKSSDGVNQIPDDKKDETKAEDTQ